ncbi:unnamed protein product [Coregonus sp. 'balchen']|nr:unnamed protein product [Coregonus sp. 'balchen']
MERERLRKGQKQGQRERQGQRLKESETEQGDRGAGKCPGLTSTQVGIFWSEVARRDEADEAKRRGGEKNRTIQETTGANIDTSRQHRWSLRERSSSHHSPLCIQLLNCFHLHPTRKQMIKATRIVDCFCPLELWRIELTDVFNVQLAPEHHAALTYRVWKVFAGAGLYCTPHTVYRHHTVMNRVMLEGDTKLPLICWGHIEQFILPGLLYSGGSEEGDVDKNKCCTLCNMSFTSAVVAQF